MFITTCSFQKSRTEKTECEAFTSHRGQESGIDLELTGMSEATITSVPHTQKQKMKNNYTI